MDAAISLATAGIAPSNSVPLANVMLWILILMVAVVPWLPAKGRFIVSALALILFMAMVLWVDTAFWVGWVEWIKEWVWLLLFPFLVFIIGIFVKSGK